MSITADREVYALETRSESLEIFSFDSFMREGESDRIEVGTGNLVDSVFGDEDATYGSLTETHDHKLNRMVGEREVEINGNFRVDGKDEIMMVTGAMAETDAGGQFFAGGMSDTLIGGAGFRMTLIGDLWIAGLVGMEEKIATGIADGITTDISRLMFEREYVGSSYRGMFAYQNSAASHTTAATTFLPLFKIVRGLRNQLPGSGAPEGEGDEPAQATPPPAAGKEAGEAGGGADGAVNAGEGLGGGAAKGAAGGDATDAANPGLLAGVADSSGPGVINAGESISEVEAPAGLHRLSSASDAVQEADNIDAVRYLDDVLDAVSDSSTAKLSDQADGAADFRHITEVEDASSAARASQSSLDGVDDALAGASNTAHLLRRFKRPPFRHPKTATRLNKLTNMSKSNQAALQAAQLHEVFNDKVLSSSRIIGSNSPATATGQESLHDAVHRLDGIADSNNTRDSWWRSHEDAASEIDGDNRFSNAGDGRHMTEGGDDIDWVQHLDEFQNALEHPHGSTVQQPSLAKDKGVFGVVNPAMQLGTAFAGLPAEGPVVGGRASRHLLPVGKDGAEVFDAHSVIRAVENLNAQAQPLANQMVQGSDMNIVSDMLAEFQKRMDDLRIQSDDTANPSGAGAAAELRRLENMTAGVEASYPKLAKAGDVAKSAPDGEKMEDIAEGSLARLFGETGDGGDSAIGWQAAARGSSENALGVANPQQDSLGTRWDVNAGVDAPSGTFRDKHFIRKLMPDGTYRYFLAWDGTEMKDFDAVYNALQGPPGRTALAVAELAETLLRSDKIRDWFASVARRLKRRPSNIADAQNMADAGLRGQLFHHASSVAETSALLDSAPGDLHRVSFNGENVAGQGDWGRVGSGSMDDNGKASAWQQSMESGDYVNPGSMDALESPSQESRVLESKVSLEEVDSQMVKSSDRASDSGGNIAASSFVPAANAADAAGDAVELTEAAKLELVRASVAKWDSGVTKFNDALDSAENSVTLRSLGTLRQIRDWFGDTVAARLTAMVKEVEPDMTRHLLVAKSQDISLTDAEAIHRQVRVMHEAALQAGDVEKADAFAEILRRAAAYMDAVNDVADRRASEANIAESAIFNAQKALQLVEANPEYQRVQDALTNIGSLDPENPDSIAAAERLSYEGSAWAVVTDLLRQNQDPRASLTRYMESRNMTRAVSQQQVEVFQEVSNQVQRVVADVCEQTGKAVPEVKNNGKNYSMLTGEDVRTLLLSFDQTDAAGADVLAVPPSQTLKDMSSERLRFQRAYEVVSQNFRDGSQDKTLRTFGTMRDLGNWYTETVSSRITEVVQQTDPNIAREWLTAGATTKEHWSTETMMMCSHITELYNAAAASGDYGLANQYVEIMRRMADYADATKEAGDRLKLASNVAEPAAFDHQLALAKIMQLESVQDLRQRVDTWTTLKGRPVTEFEWQEAVMKLSGWQIVIDLLKNGEDPRASLQRYFDAGGKGAMEQVDNVRREYSRALKTAELCISITCNQQNIRVPELLHDGKVFSVFDDSDSIGLIAAFNKIDASFDGSSAVKPAAADSAPPLFIVEDSAQVSTSAGAVFSGEVTETEAVRFGVTPEFPKVEVRSVEDVDSSAPAASVVLVRSGIKDSPALTLPPAGAVDPDSPVSAVALDGGGAGDAAVLKLETEIGEIDSSIAVSAPAASLRFIQSGDLAVRRSPLDPTRVSLPSNVLFTKLTAVNLTLRDSTFAVRSAAYYLAIGHHPRGNQNEPPYAESSRFGTVGAAPFGRQEG